MHVPEKKVRDVLNAIKSIPKGFPISLQSWEVQKLAKAIVEGERKEAPDGTELVRIKNKWYNADISNPGEFMREWKDPETRAPEESPEE